jgi:hypothetical protein
MFERVSKCFEDACMADQQELIPENVQVSTNWLAPNVRVRH